MWLRKLIACYDAAGLRGTQAEWELGTVCQRLGKQMAQVS